MYIYIYLLQKVKQILPAEEYILSGINRCVQYSFNIKKYCFLLHWDYHINNEKQYMIYHDVNSHFCAHLIVSFV